MRWWFVKSRVGEKKGVDKRAGEGNISRSQDTVLSIYGVSGDHSEGVTPVPMPNTEVKPFAPMIVPKRCESRSSPGLALKPPRFEKRGGFFLVRGSVLAFGVRGLVRGLVAGRGCLDANDAAEAAE